MCGGGKGVQQTSQQVAYPSLPAASAYSSAMDRISQATSQPFQKYSSDPNAYVAPLTSTQTGAIQNVTGLQGMTDPYYRTAGAMTLAGAAPVNRLTSGQIQEYMNPYMSQVVDPVQNALRQQFGMQQAQQQAQAIKSGAFGGERAGVERALLRGQQGLALGQALSPLYQTGYGQALQTAQGQQGIEGANLQRLLGAGAQAGGLGTAAQDAALKQASAQLQAGTLQQQTETAQKQALYNEFQKERMYPLQTAQLYAQTAGALGPLMGSTSQGYQQMPFFGGFAADGGAIKGYDEGLGAARMGGAVDEAGDYARGGYAHGGIGAHLQYTDMTDPNAAEKRKMDNLLASQQASLMAGLDTSGAEFPTGEIRPGRLLEASGLPERRQGIVERGLKAAVSDPSGTYEKAKGLYEGYGKVKDYFSSPSASSGLLNLASETLGRGVYAEGGDVHNNAMQDLLSNPIQVSKPHQPQQAPQEQKSGLLGGLMKAGAGMAANYFLPGSGPLVSSALGAAGMADGGRAGYQAGGPSEDDFFKRGIQGAESAHRQFDKYGRTLTSPKGAEGISQIMPGTGPEAAKLAGLPYDRQRLRTDEEYNTALGNAYYNKQLKDFGTEELAAAAYNAGPGRVRQALARAEREGGDVMSYLPAETRNYVPTVMRKAGLSQDAIGEKIAGLSPRDRSMMAEYPPRPTTESPGPSSGLGSAQVREKGFMERTQEHPESLILPVLQGIGAMAGSKNRYALGALAEGLGAGAGSYMDMAGKQSEIDKRRQEQATEAEKTGAEYNIGKKTAAETETEIARKGQVEALTKEIGAGTEKVYAEIAGNSVIDVAGVPHMKFIDPKTGTYRLMSLGEWNSLDPADRPSIDPRIVQITKDLQGKTGVSAPAGGAPGTGATLEPPKVSAPQDLSVPKEVGDYAQKVAVSKASLSKDTRNKIPDLFSPQIELAKSAEEQKQNLLPLVGALAALPAKESVLTSGKQQEILNPLVNYLAGIARTFGQEEFVLSKLKANPNMLADTEEIKKLVNQMQQTATQNNQLHAFGAFKELAEGIPSLLNSPGAQRRLAAQLLASNQRQIDKNNVFMDWRRQAAGRNGANAEYAQFTSPEANKFFDDTYSNAFYAPDRERIVNIFSVEVPVRGGGQRSLAEVLAKYPNKLTPEYKEYLNKEYPGVLRYFGIR
jgi:hypothetical protein